MSKILSKPNSLHLPRAMLHLTAKGIRYIKNNILIKSKPHKPPKQVVNLEQEEQQQVQQEIKEGKQEVEDTKMKERGSPKSLKPGNKKVCNFIDEYH